MPNRSHCSRGRHSERCEVTRHLGELHAAPRSREYGRQVDLQAGQWSKAYFSSREGLAQEQQHRGFVVVVPKI